MKSKSFQNNILFQNLIMNKEDKTEINKDQILTLPDSSPASRLKSLNEQRSSSYVLGFQENEREKVR